MLTEPQPHLNMSLVKVQQRESEEHVRAIHAYIHTIKLPASVYN